MRLTLRQTLKRTLPILIGIALIIFVSFVQADTASAATKPTLEKASVKLYLGGTAKIKVLNAPRKAKITYKSGNKRIVTVSKKGVVKAKKTGTAKIKVTVKKGKKKTKLTLTVTARKAKVAVLDCGVTKSIKVKKALTVTNGSAIRSKALHADTQVKNILGEAPKADIISIRVSDSDDIIYSFNMAKGVEKAIAEKVDFIYYGSYAPGCTDEEYEAVMAATGKGIRIVGPAGNDSGADAREMNWMTGTKGVTIVGAYGKNAILPKSNIHADVYIKAGSTSAAAARYAGMLAIGKIYDDHYEK